MKLESYSWNLQNLIYFFVSLNRESHTGLVRHEYLVTFHYSLLPVVIYVVALSEAPHLDTNTDSIQLLPRGQRNELKGGFGQPYTEDVGRRFSTEPRGAAPKDLF